MLCSCSQELPGGNGKGLCAMSASQLYNIIWEGVEMLHTVGLRVRAFVSDGASTNRKFYDLCAKSNYYTTNPFAEGRIYFFADAPHLLKTARNNLENSGGHNRTRNMMVNISVVWFSYGVELAGVRDLV